MKLILKLVIALACVVNALIVGLTGLVMLFSPDTVRQDFGESDPSVAAGLVALLMAVIFLGTAYSTFPNPQGAVIGLAIIIALQAEYVFGLRGCANRQSAVVALSATLPSPVAPRCRSQASPVPIGASSKFWP